MSGCAKAEVQLTITLPENVHSTVRHQTGILRSKWEK